jgi:hypothetical protein
MPEYLGQQENTAQDAQKRCPARPQQAKRRRRTLRYVELLSEARTPLADFFSILSDLHDGRGRSLGSPVEKLKTF